MAATWKEFEEQAPELAAAIGARFGAVLHAVLATLRVDGSPRLTGLKTRLGDGELWLAMMPDSRKADDLPLAIPRLRSSLLQKLHPVLRWIAQGLANINEIVDWALVPVLALVRLVWKGVQGLISVFSPRGLSASHPGEIYEAASSKDLEQEEGPNESHPTAVPVHEEQVK